MSTPAADPLALAAVAAGHRGLLATFAEFRAGLDEAERMDEDALRGMLAFLRQGVIAFARQEERVLGARGDEAETLAFEHAFLAAEIDALGGEVAAMRAAPPFGGEREPAAALVRRRADRIQAVLELHVMRGEDRGITAAPPPETAADLRAGPGGGPRELGAEEVDAFLRRCDWGTLCTAGLGEPYAVPVSYGWDGCFVYVATGPGRKDDALRSDPRVCLNVARVESGDRWRSVVVTGVAQPVRGIAGRAAALNVLRRQRASCSFSMADAARLARARLFRIVPRELTGRERG